MLRINKNNLEFALVIFALICFDHSKSLLTVTPRYDTWHFVLSQVSDLAIHIGCKSPVFRVT